MPQWKTKVMYRQVNKFVGEQLIDGDHDLNENRYNSELAYVESMLRRGSCIRASTHGLRLIRGSSCPFFIPSLPSIRVPILSSLHRLSVLARWRPQATRQNIGKKTVDFALA